MKKKITKDKGGGNCAYTELKTTSETFDDTETRVFYF